MKKRIVLISETLSGGVRRHVVDILENLDKDKFEIYFMYSTGRIDDLMKLKLPSLKEKGINLIKIDNFQRNIGINDFKAFKGIYRKLNKIQPDIVHCHSSKAGVLGRVAARLLNVKQIYYTPHAYIIQNPDGNKYKKYIFIKIEKILSKYFTTKTINVSYGEKLFAINAGIDVEEKFKVIYNGIFDIDKMDGNVKKSLKNEFRIKDEDFVIGTIARMDEQKDPDTFISIAKEILKKYKNIKFIYVGNGKLYEHIRQRVLDENLEDSVILTGFRSDTSEILNIFDVFLTTALYEGMPYSLIEACRARLPILATNVIGNNEVVTDGKNGMLFNINDIKGARLKIEKIINSNDIYDLSNKSREKFEIEFNIEKMIDKLQILYLMNKE